jgi:hypothetical protein
MCVAEGERAARRMAAAAQSARQTRANVGYARLKGR